MPAADAVRMKARLFEDLNDRRMQSMLQSFVDTTRGEPGDDYDIPIGYRLKTDDGRDKVAKPLRDRNPRFKKGVTGKIISTDMRRWLQVGETFYVSPLMMDLAMEASRTMPDEKVFQSDPPSTHGFMWLPQPMRFMDIRGRLLSCNAVVWAGIGEGCVVWYFTDKDDPYDMVNIDTKARFTEAEFATMPKLQLAAEATFRWDQEIPRTVHNTTLLPNAAKVDIHWEGDNLVFATDEFMELNVEVRRDPLLAVMLCIWRLMQQTISSVERERVDRPVWRHARRHQFRDEAVTVISLRRREATGETGEGHVEWSHQWIVRGHWRRQRCKVEGEWTHRVIYINPHLKGPEDKPLLVRDRVNALVR